MEQTNENEKTRKDMTIVNTFPTTRSQHVPKTLLLLHPTAFPISKSRVCGAHVVFPHVSNANNSYLFLFFVFSPPLTIGGGAIAIPACCTCCALTASYQCPPVDGDIPDASPPPFPTI